MFNIQEYRKILEEIELFGEKFADCTISKNHPKKFVEEALKQGSKIFSENGISEKPKQSLKTGKKIQNLELHSWSPLQTNKVKEAVKLFVMFHTLDREKLAKEIIKQEDLKKNKKFLFQVNTRKRRK